MKKHRQTIRLPTTPTMRSLAPPALRLTPYAWRKLLFLRDLGPTEVGGFAVSAADDLLLVIDIRLITQLSSPVTVKFADEAVADFFDDQVDQGHQPEQFARIWVHTHPGNSAAPSSTDEETFARCFGSADWAIMFILARGGETYARLAVNGGPGAEILLPVEIDFGCPFAGSEEGTWELEYARAVTEDCFLSLPAEDSPLGKAKKPWDRDDNLADDWLHDPLFYSERLEVADGRF